MGLLGGCSTIMGLERPERVPGNDAGESGVAGADGGENGTASGQGGAGAGSGGAPASPGAAGADAGANAGGRAGEGGRDAEAGRAGARDGASGESGQGGQLGAGGSSDGGQSGAPPTGPFLGGPCDGSRDFECTEGEPHLVLACTDGIWRVSEACGTDSRCDPKYRECRAEQFPCEARDDSFCEGDFALTDCSNPFIPAHFQCPFGCGAGRCLPGSGDELVVHTEQVPWNAASTLWREPIAVCFHDAGEDAALVAVIRDEIERGWGRLLDIEFPGWAACTGDETGRRVELAFRNDCEMRLGSAVADGAPPAGEARRVEFCRTYYTAGGELEVLLEHEELLRFVARHQFGHVLGLRDQDRSLLPVVMTRALQESEATSLVISSVDISPFRYDYGQKPPRSLVTEKGACLSPTLQGFHELPCSHDKSGFFDFTGSEVASARDGIPGCFSVPSGDGALVGLGECGDAEGKTELRFRHALWSTPDRCIAPERAEVGSPLRAMPCGKPGDPTQSWWFEILAADADVQVTRIRFEATGDCLGLDEPAQFGAIPRLETCDDELDYSELFDLWKNGLISHYESDSTSALCTQWDPPDGVVYLDSRCSFDTYWIFGALETPDRRWLSFTHSGEVEELRAVSPASGALPLASQIFGLTL